MEENQQIQINMDLQLFSLSNVNVAFDEENFALVLMSGNSARRYVASPKHAKRLMLLLQSKIAEYEKSFGELKTSLPSVKNESSKKEKAFGF
jgi:hypothetical protein